MNDDIITFTSPIEFPELCRTLPGKFEPGVHAMGRAFYDNVPALSSTVIKKWLRHETTPSVFKAWLDGRWDEEPTEALLIGRALDCARLDGDFAAQYATVPPNAPRRPSKAQREAKKPAPETLAAIGWWNNFNEASAGKVILKQEQLECVLGMNKALGEKPGLEEVFGYCTKVALVGEIGGWAAKGEIDLWDGRSTHIWDIKTAEDVSEQAFKYAINKFGYLTQAVWYLALARSLDIDKSVFNWIAVGKEPPYPVRTYSFDIGDNVKHLAILNAELKRIKAGIATLTRALTEQDFRDDSDWHVIEFDEWQVAKAFESLNE